MITRRNLLLGLAAMVPPAIGHARQAEQPRKGKDESRTVTLTIEGMT